MAAPVDIPELVLALDLDTHTKSGPDTPADLESWLKRAALFSRGVVVADADLNHNRVFHAALRHDRDAFRAALRTGFLRRAPRETPNGPVTQRELYERFCASAPHAVAHVPPDYPAAADAMLASVELTNPPLVWELETMAAIFGQRVRGELKAAAGYLATDEARVLAERAYDHVQGSVDAGTPVTARQIEAAVFASRDDASRPAHERAVFDVIKGAYNGNLKYVFPGLCASDPAGTSAERSAGVTVPLPTRGWVWEVNLTALQSLRFEDVIEIREWADPAPLLAARHAALTRPVAADAAQGADGGLASAAEEYLERLARRHQAFVLRRTEEDVGRVAASMNDWMLGGRRRALVVEALKITGEVGLLVADVAFSAAPGIGATAAALLLIADVRKLALEMEHYRDAQAGDRGSTAEVRTALRRAMAGVDIVTRGHVELVARTVERARALDAGGTGPDLPPAPS